MKTVKCFLLFLSMLGFCNTNSQWIFQYNTGGQNVSFWAMQFIDSNIGFVVGAENHNPIHPKICKTTNSGLIWDTISIYQEVIADIYDLTFINDNTGYICGSSVNVYKTTNGGINWSPYLLPYYSVSQT
jgi:photosystem II stability/assembly factor-like uncharacterized protein